jgi:site-specific DNA-methyltransferase (adenine-specific)
VANPRPLFEPILWLQKPYRTGGTLADNLLAHNVGAWNQAALAEYGGHPFGQDGETFSNIIRIAAEKGDRGLHEAQKPLKLMECLVALSTVEGAVVLDPFAGSGTTCLAAKRLGRSYVGIEIDEKYVKTANQRLDGAAKGRPLDKVSGDGSISLFDFPEAPIE